MALRGDTPPSAGLVIGLLVYCAIVALRGDTPPTAAPLKTPPRTPPTPPAWGYAAYGGPGYWATSVLCYSRSPWGYTAYGGTPGFFFLPLVGEIPPRFFNNFFPHLKKIPYLKKKKNSCQTPKVKKARRRRRRL